MSLWLPFLTGLVGIIGTIVAYRLNPINQARDELKKLLGQVKYWEGIRDAAIAKNDSDTLSIAVNSLARLRRDQDAVYKRFPKDLRR